MKQIIYYVAASLDGFIAGSNDDVSNFIYEGDGIKKYIEDLQSFKTVIMGKRTYEFGYKFGAIAGQPSPAYPHMKHYIFANDLKFENKSEMVEVKNIDIEEIKKIKNTSETDIYLCGGGIFAGWLLDNREIDILKIKLNPVMLRSGISLFGNSQTKVKMELIDSNIYEKGLQIMTYKIIYV